MENAPKMTEQEAKAKAEKKIRKAAHRDARNGAFDVIKELVDKQPDKKFAEALATVRPSLYGIVRSGGGSAIQAFIEFVAEKKTVKESVIFEEFKMGRKECAGYIRKHLKKVDPAERTWISFDKGTGVYTLAGKGKNAPQNWQGFVPVEDSIDLGKKPEMK